MSETPENPTPPASAAPAEAPASAPTPSPPPGNLTQVILSVLAVTAVGFVAGRMVGRPAPAPASLPVLSRVAPIHLRDMRRHTRGEANKRVDLRSALLHRRGLMAHREPNVHGNVREAFLRRQRDGRESGAAASAVQGPVDDCLKKVGGAAKVAVRFDVQKKGDSGAALANAQVVAANFTDDAVKRCVVDAINGGQISRPLPPANAMTASFSVGAAVR